MTTPSPKSREEPTIASATTDALLSELEARAALSPGQWSAKELEALGRLVHRVGWEVQPS